MPPDGPKYPELPPVTEPDPGGDDAYLIVGWRQQPVMGGMTLLPPKPYAIERGERHAIERINFLDKNTPPEQFHGGLRIHQPWHDDDPEDLFDFDADDYSMN